MLTFAGPFPTPPDVLNPSGPSEEAIFLFLEPLGGCLDFGIVGLGISLPPASLSFSLLPTLALESFGDETTMFPSWCSCLLNMAACTRDLPSYTNSHYCHANNE